MPINSYKFELMPLPYVYDALEPFIDEETMRIHHDKHLGAYVDKLNSALEGYPALQGLSLQQLLKCPDSIPLKIRTAVVNNGGGVYNHNFFFNTLKPHVEGNMPSGSLAQAIDKEYGCFESFKKKFKEQALAVFGSGYLWLVGDSAGGLRLVKTANQDTPITYGYCPILPIDVWEHAYYLKHQNRRDEYIDDWWNVVNWAKADKYYRNC